MAVSVIRMESTKSAVNAAIGAEIRATRSRMKMTRDRLAQASGITVVQIERIENNKRDLNVSQLFALAAALDLDAEDVIRRAVDAAGGLDALTAEAEPMSEATPKNVTPIVRKPKPALTTEQIEKAAKQAATIDDEMDTDEQFD